VPVLSWQAIGSIRNCDREAEKQKNRPRSTHFS
jgi:hypothetical protein